MGDAVSHAVLPGLAVSVVLGIPLILGAFIAAIGCATSIGFLKKNSRVKEDAIMGIVFSGMFALGLVMLTRIDSDVHLLHILLGHVLGISQQDFIQGSIIAVVCSVFMLIKRRDFMLYCFDSAHGKVIGLPVTSLHFSLLTLLALTIVASLKTVGMILVIAMLIAPGAIGFLLTKSFDRMMLIAITTAIFSCIMGLHLSFYMDVATAPLIVLIQFVLFLLALLMIKTIPIATRI